MKNKLSIIIPCYKEEQNIVAFLEDLKKKGFGNSEIIVVDGSPDDLTKELLGKREEVIYTKLEKSFRASSINRGASLATGDLLIFLHADTIFPEGSFEELSVLDLDFYNYGCFYKEFSPTNFMLNIISGINNFQTNIFGTMLGDNAIFVSKKLFKKIGGFQEIKLMEDIEISKTLKKEGKIKIIKKPIKTSSRKFQKRGVIKTFFFMQYIKFLYFIGTDTETLEQKYRKF